VAHGRAFRIAMADGEAAHCPDSLDPMAADDFARPWRRRRALHGDDGDAVGRYGQVAPVMPSTA